ncbi:uncharacterized protein BP5553_06846 [Venustampulla echinocandica]|uniref:Zn(2)-C6 fungal-type domain-containing protein n=1 Tax=Venustampulla echinocandica TaxID=2656787 RepID=A0A370TL38_9HELO|nr:uncharacterized protein BP5553_06846 [Venustampulla echinocandica]RDL36234.1 hypothetical protein BP5553_06846 [Venustampulla echinocandica]
MEVQTEYGRRPNYHAPPDGPERHAKRQKIKLACQECRDRKIRCDGGRPMCNSCTRKKLTPDRCIYSASDTGSDDSYVRALESRVRELESSNIQNSGRSLEESNELLHPAVVQFSPESRETHDISPRHRGRDITPESHSHTHERVPNTLGLQTPTSRDLPYSVSPGNSQSIWPVGYENYMSNLPDVPPVARQSTELPSRDSDLQHENVAQTKPGGSIAGSNTGPTPGSEDSPAFLGSSSAVGFMAEVYETFRGRNKSTSKDDSQTFTSRNETCTSPPPWLGYSGNEGDEMTSPNFVVPPKRIADRYLQSYWDGAYPLQPFISRRTFMRRYDYIWSSHPSTGADEESPFGNERSQRSEHIFHSRLLQPSNEAIDFRSNGSWVYSTGSVSEESLVDRVADLDLHRVQSMTFGRPLMLEHPSLGPLPQMIDEEYLAIDPAVPHGCQPRDIPAKSAYLVSVLQLSNITAEILGLFYSTTSEKSIESQPLQDYNSLLRVDAELVNWQNELPLFLRYDCAQETIDPNNLFLRQAHLLNHRFLHSRILLFRRAVVQLAAKSFVQGPVTTVATLEQIVALGCVEICTSAAQELLDALQPHIGTLFVPPAWFTVFLIYTAGTVLAVTFLTPAFQTPLTAEQTERLHKSWNTCIECLKQYRRLGIPFASKCLLNLQKMHNSNQAENQHDNLHGLNVTVSDAGEGINASSAEDRADVGRRSDFHPVTDGPPRNWEHGGEYSDMLMPNPWWPDDNIDWLIDIANSNQVK